MIMLYRGIINFDATVLNFLDTVDRCHKNPFTRKMPFPLLELVHGLENLFTIYRCVKIN